MSRYQELRSSSPTNHRSSKEIELEEQLPDQEKIQSTEDEQTERLLPGGGSDNHVHPEDVGISRKPQRRWLRKALTGLAGVVLFSIAIFLLSLYSASNSEDRVLRSFRKPSSDYIIPPDWDYDSPPRARYYHWTITDITANPDGVFRPLLVINGQFPGPMIVCNEGDTIVVDVVNNAKNATAIHWHGLFQNGTNFMDGTVGVTQCPIAPGHSFRYQFTVKGQAGTYFYHGHQAAQGLDGLFGPLIVLSNEERQTQAYHYDTDRVVMVQDWYHDPSDGLLRQTLSPGSENSPTPNGALINGVNVVDCDLHPNRRCDNTTAQLPTFDLTHEKRHRLRIINVGGFGWFEVSVDNHFKLPVTEVDGVSVEPETDTTVLVGPGQRYSVLLRADRNFDSGLFWFRARMIKHCFAENVLPDQGVAGAKAIIRYDRGPALSRSSISLPTTEPDSGKFTVICKDKAPGTYKPRPKLAAPEYAHHSWYFRVNLEIGAWRLERGFLNQSTLRPQLQSPTLHRVVDGLTTGNASFDIQGVNDVAFNKDHELVISSNEVEVVDIILQNFDEGNHPFHLHGTQMFILAAGHGYFPGYEALGLQPEGKGLLNPEDDSIVSNPTRRDVTTVESFGWTLIRFVADNPGVWLFHCHMIWHAEAGMGMQFVSRLGSMRNWTIPDQNARLCEAPAAELEKGSTPKDEIWFGDFGSNQS
ncbi:hypothetical protein N0V93_001321 [Gnomoniopsis smithogilvyi]|uniref:Laccase n=1 Tax=Gnomoniopsis smithogilvyi TaxID=1191159 RepID=A0A9W9D135_9PEZI|nr:hypothetical protein N0V93_001321 [Gnomoniopsis smithogilvyi]